MTVRLNQTAASFGTTIFAEMSALAHKHGAVNLGQGFPDFAGPGWIKEAAAAAITGDHNQYAPGIGLLALREVLAARASARLGRIVDPDTSVTVTSGGTEAIYASMLGLLNPGDEVILIEPMYDSYEPTVRLAGAVARHLPLRAPASGNGPFWLDLDELRGLINPRTRVLVLNTPHNPSGKVFTREELTALAGLCIEHDLVVLSDEVYEELTYDGRPHVPMASIPGMWERTVTVGSSGKIFSLTGWKIGWTIAPPELALCTRRTHQFITFATATPLQMAIAAGFREAESRGYYDELRRFFGARRDQLLAVLDEVGLRTYVPEGSYFILCDFAGFAGRLGDEDDGAFARRLTTSAGVAAIPPSPFYAAEHKQLARTLVRFAFCKREGTLAEAAVRLRRWVQSAR
jgi:N-succinyldiaminopimelate aminotransferase